MPPPLTPTARAARANAAPTITAAADRLHNGEPLTPEARTALTDLLHHTAGPARNTLGTTTWDRLVRLAELVEEPYRVHREGVGRLPDGWTGGEPRRLSKLATYGRTP